MKCSFCRATNQAYALFCLECGEPLRPETPRETPSGVALRAARENSGQTPRSARDLLRGRQWEVTIGLLLLVVVVGAGIFDAVRQSTVSSAYRNGVRAAEAQHWDEAVAQLRQADDHRDAPARLEEAKAAVFKRNQLYQQGLEAFRQSDWGGAIRLFGGVREIEPDYAEVETLLAAARDEQIDQGVAGIFYQSASPAFPGIFRKTALNSRDTYLLYSDASSELLIMSRDGNNVVYRSGSGTARRLFLARFPISGGLQPGIVELSTLLDPKGSGFPAATGFWWTSGERGRVFVRYGDLSITPLTVAKGWKVLKYDERSERLLLAQSSEVAGATRTRLVLTDAFGGNARQVVDAEGLISNVQLSPDGSWLLYQQEQTGALATYRSPVRGTAGLFGAYWLNRDSSFKTISLRLTRLDAQEASASSDTRLAQRERLLDYLVLSADDKSGARIEASFAPLSDASFVASDRFDLNGRRVTLYDVRRGLQITFWPDRAPRNSGGAFSFSPPGNNLLLQAQQQSGVQVRIRPLDLFADSHDLTVELDEQEALYPSMSRHEDYLLYRIIPSRQGRGLQQMKLYSVPLDAEGRIVGAAVQLFDESYDIRSRHQVLVLNQNPAGTMISYISPAAELWAVALDGSSRIMLAESVVNLWVPDAQ